jgi:L,D-transpeptidase catalytic domain
MKKKIKGFYLIVSSFIIAALHLPFAFAKSASAGAKLFFEPVADSLPVTETNNNQPIIIEPSFVKSVYDSLHLDVRGLSKQAYDYAKRGFDKLVQEGRLINNSIISIADFTQPSSAKRLFVIDVKNYKVLLNSLVAHGRNSGKEVATSFSNQHESYKSSPGFYITRETYEGKNGYSLKLDGIENGINDNAFERGIVIHGASYVSDNFVNMQGYIGRSQGCPAVPVSENKTLINLIKDGTCFFVFHPSYIPRSAVLR